MKTLEYTTAKGKDAVKPVQSVKRLKGKAIRVVDATGMARELRQDGNVYSFQGRVLGQGWRLVESPDGES